MSVIEFFQEIPFGFEDTFSIFVSIAIIVFGLIFIINFIKHFGKILFASGLILIGITYGTDIIHSTSQTFSLIGGCLMIIIGIYFMVRSNNEKQINQPSIKEGQIKEYMTTWDYKREGRQLKTIGKGVGATAKGVGTIGKEIWKGASATKGSIKGGILKIKDEKELRRWQKVWYGVQPKLKNMKESQLLKLEKNYQDKARDFSAYPRTSQQLKMMAAQIDNLRRMLYKKAKMPKATNTQKAIEAAGKMKDKLSIKKNLQRRKEEKRNKEKEAKKAQKEEEEKNKTREEKNQDKINEISKLEREKNALITGSNKLANKMRKENNPKRIEKLNKARKRMIKKIEKINKELRNL